MCTTPLTLEGLHSAHTHYLIWYDIFNCNWVDTRWQ